MIKLSLMILLLVLAGCFENKHEQTATPIRTNEVAQDIQVPKPILKELEKDLGEDTKLMSAVYMFIPLQVEFTEKNEGVLKSSPTLISFPKGGGRVDLKDIVTGPGSFYMSFPSEQFAKLPELTHLYYVSQAPIKKIGDESFGLGCGKWVDLKKQYKNLQKKNFLKLNTTDLRHLYVLAGHYIFVFRENNQFSMTQLTVTDSQYENDLCYTKAGANE